MKWASPPKKKKYDRDPFCCCLNTLLVVHRNVKFINFYDVVLDYILIDSFEVSFLLKVPILTQQIFRKFSKLAFSSTALK